MTKVAIYPGTFDPITFGHIDVIKKSLRLFEKVIVAVSDGENKTYLFDVNERIEIVKKALFNFFMMSKKIYRPWISPGPIRWNADQFLAPQH